MVSPLIGLTTSRLNNKQGTPIVSANEAYVRAVSHAGGVPVLIPVGLSEDALGALLSRLAGIVFTGGGDVHPRLYAPEAEHMVTAVDEDRDRVEFFLLQKALQDEKPILGICRGLQMMNVALGGTLYADLQTQKAGAAKHDFFPGQPRDYLAHRVEIQPGSRLAQILGQSEVTVNSMHHQGVDNLAPALTSTATSLDGVVEACELQGYRFGVAVQWHPECLQTDPAMRGLFKAFVSEAESFG